jgi:serine/threonine protein kinase
MTDESPQGDVRLLELLGAYYDGGADTDERRAAFLAGHPELADQLARYFAEQDGLRRTLMLSPSLDGMISGVPVVSSLGDAIPPRSHPSYLEEYELIDQISSGGMGIVYRARRSGLDRVVALKVLRPDRATASDLIRFQNEMQAIADLDHPSIVPIYDVGPDFFTMKLISGGSLAESLSRYMRSPRETARLVVKLARAVQHAHERGILHRDLKPSNVLLDETGEPYVSDFGLAKRLGFNLELTQSGEILGTFNYMAPEQATGHAKDVTTRTDIWGLGTVLYAMLTGRPPFLAESAAALLVQLQEKEPDRPSALDPSVNLELEAICLKCLEKEPDKRYASATALADDLERWLAGRSTIARPVGRLRRIGRWCRRNPVVAALSAGVALLAMAIGVSIVVGWVSSESQRRRAESRLSWVLQGITEPLKKLASPELARDPIWVESRRMAVTEAIEAYQEFLKSLDDSRQSGSERVDLWIHIGLLHTILDDRPQARDAYYKAVRLAERLVQQAPKRASLWDQVGMAYYHIGMELWYEERRAEAKEYFRLAVGAFDEALRRDSYSLIVLQHSAWFLTVCPDPQFRQPERALRLAKRLVAIATPQDDRAHFSGGVRPLFTLGLAQYRIGDWTAARRSLEDSCRRRNGGDAYEWFILAMVHARMGNEAEARASCEQAVRWTRANRYGDFELHFFDDEAARIPGLNAQRLRVRAINNS